MRSSLLLTFLVCSCDAGAFEVLGEGEMPAEQASLVYQGVASFLGQEEVVTPALTVRWGKPCPTLKNVQGCFQPTSMEVYVDDCPTMVHEFTHVVHYVELGELDYRHLRPEWLQLPTEEFCSEIEGKKEQVLP